MTLALVAAVLIAMGGVMAFASSIIKAERELNRELRLENADLCSRITSDLALAPPRAIHPQPDTIPSPAPAFRMKRPEPLMLPPDAH